MNQFNFYLQTIFKVSPMFFGTEQSLKSELPVRNMSKSMQRNRKSVQKYIVIDSQNDEEYVGRKIWNSELNVPLMRINFERESTRSQFNSHLYNEFQSQLEYLRKIDQEEVLEAQKQVDLLQKECCMLEKMISEMIKEEAELIVEERRRLRSKSMQEGQRLQPKKCSVHLTHRQQNKPQGNRGAVLNFKLSKCSLFDEQPTPQYLIHNLQASNKNSIESKSISIKINPKSCRIQQQNKTPQKNTKHQRQYSSAHRANTPRNVNSFIKKHRF